MAADVYTLTLYWEDADGDTMENVLHYQQQTASALDPFQTATDFMNAWDTACTTKILACMSPDMTLQALSCRRVNNSGGPTATKSISRPGSRTGDMMTNGAAINCCFIPATAPWKEGHFYMGGIVAADVVADFISNTLLGLINTFLTAAIDTAITAASVAWDSCIWKRKTTTAVSIQETIVRGTLSLFNKRLRPHQRP